MNLLSDQNYLNKDVNEAETNNVEGHLSGKCPIEQ